MCWNAGGGEKLLLKGFVCIKYDIVGKYSKNFKGILEILWKRFIDIFDTFWGNFVQNLENSETITDIIKNIAQAN